MIDLEDRSIIISISCIARKYHVFGTIPFTLFRGWGIKIGILFSHANSNDYCFYILYYLHFICLPNFCYVSQTSEDLKGVCFEGSSLFEPCRESKGVCAWIIFRWQSVILVRSIVSRRIGSKGKNRNYLFLF